MKLKLRKNKNKPDVWYCECWIIGPDGKRQHQTQILADASGPNAVSRKQASMLLERASTVLSSARAAARTTGLSEFTSMEAAATLWFDRQSADWAPATKTAYSQQLRAHILPALGQRAVGEIRHMDAEALYGALARRGLRHDSIRQVKTIVDRLFWWLRRQDVDVHDVRADVPRRAAPRRQTGVLTSDQIAAVMADETWIGASCRVMLLCGLRPGEALALRHCDIEGSEIIVSRASKRDGLGGTKTGATRRVPVPPMLETELGARAGALDDLLFPRAGGGDAPMSVSYLGRLVAARFKVKPRQFRATFATLVDRDPVNTAALLGHSTPRTTVQHYIKPQVEEARRAVVELERKLRKAG